jgi:hypothetical protein
MVNENKLDNIKYNNKNDGQKQNEYRIRPTVVPAQVSSYQYNIHML